MKIDEVKLLKIIEEELNEVMGTYDLRMGKGLSQQPGEYKTPEWDHAISLVNKAMNMVLRELSMINENVGSSKEFQAFVFNFETKMKNNSQLTITSDENLKEYQGEFRDKTDAVLEVFNLAKSAKEKMNNRFIWVREQGSAGRDSYDKIIRLLWFVQEVAGKFWGNLSGYVQLYLQEPPEIPKELESGTR